MNNIFVGNLSFEATKEDVMKLFEPFGTVANVLILEGKKGKSRGYGFVDMPNEEEKNAAIAALQGKEFMWRPLSVSPVMPKVKDEVRSDRGSRSSRKSPGSSKSIIREDGSKYYGKFDGPPKPWRKGSPASKPSRKKDEGSRPYYGKKKEGPSFSKFSTKPKPSKGFKMFHKVSGASRTGPKKGQTDGA
jgi:RNA recognition motif-containing protein